MRGNRAGDWNNDGFDSVGVYRNGEVYLTNYTGVGGATLDVAYSYGTAGDIPVAGRWATYCANADPNNPPPPSVCLIPQCEVRINKTLGFIAPVGNNPPDLTANGSLKYAEGTVTIDERAIDPLSATSDWYLHVANRDTWIKESEAGLVDTNACVPTLPDVSPNYALPNIAWNTFQSRTQFARWPVDIADVCDSQNSLKEIWGLNKSLDPDKFDYPRKIHHGVDFFVAENNGKVSIYAIDDGIVVGIVVRRGGIFENPDIEDSTVNERTVWTWRGAEIVDSPVGYAVIVRHGHFYVLYGHLKSINIWVGKSVSAGDELGVLGRNGHRHLHIELHSYGQSISPTYSSYVDTANGGILIPNNEASLSVAPYFYDLMQFLPNPAPEINLKDLVKTSGLTPRQASSDPQEEFAVIPISSACGLTYITQQTNKASLSEVTANGYSYRGFFGYPREGLPSVLLNPFHITQP